MGAFWGLPDFGARQPTGDFEICASYEPGPYLLWPNDLAVGLLAPGRPDFQIVLVRSSEGGADYGVFELGIGRQQDTDGALAWLRGVDAKATVAAAPFQSGFIRLVAGPDLITVPPDLQQPSPIGWGGINATRWSFKLSPDSALILKAGLTSTIVLTARAEVEVAGVAPRVPSTAVFDPSKLLAPLVPADATSRQIPRTMLDAYFNDSLSNLPGLSLEGNPAPDRQAFALAMADRVRMRFGRFVPSPGGAGPSYLELAADVPSGTFRWNLAEPIQVLRPWVFTLDPFKAARDLAKVSGIDALYHEVTTTPVPFGFFQVDVSALLPPVRLGLIDLGAVIEVAAKPPFRPQLETHTVPFTPPEDHAVVQLRLSPLERLHYQSRTYAEVVESTGVRRLDDDPIDQTDEAIRFQPHDFPVDLLEMSGDPSLFALATLSGTLSYAGPDATQASTTFSLSAAQPKVSVALPRDAVQAAITVTAKPVPSAGAPAGATIALGPLPAVGQLFTLGSFTEYGLHKVSIGCTFAADSAGVYAIDVVADGRPETDLVTFFLTRDNPTADWSYVATSPFAAGYRWRAHGSGAWSSSLAPVAPLLVTAPAQPAAKPQVWDLDGVHLYTIPGDPPGRVRYVPGDPTAQVDDQGRPTLMLIDAGKTAVLTLGARLVLSDAQRNDLEATLLVQLPSIDRIDFQPAAFTVGAVTLALGDGTGAYQALATTPSMGAPPYNATFSVQLDADQRARAVAAVSGATRLLKVDYPLSLPADVAASFDGAPASLVRSADVASWFPDGTGAAHVQSVGA
jgi:hypothetical protein